MPDARGYGTVNKSHVATPVAVQAERKEQRRRTLFRNTADYPAIHEHRDARVIYARGLRVVAKSARSRRFVIRRGLSSRCWTNDRSRALSELVVYYSFDSYRSINCSPGFQRESNIYNRTFAFRPPLIYFPMTRTIHPQTERSDHRRVGGWCLIHYLEICLMTRSTHEYGRVV